MASLQQILSWFKTGLFPNEDQFRQTWLSYWHKSEKIPQSQVFGLQETIESATQGLIYRPPVATSSDLYATYPDAKTSWAAIVEATGTIWQCEVQSNGTKAWTDTGLREFPVNVATKNDLSELDRDLKQKEAVNSSYLGLFTPEIVLEQSGKYVSISGDVTDSSSGNLNIYACAVAPGKAYISAYSGLGGVSVLSAWKSGVFVKSLLAGIGADNLLISVVDIPEGIDTLKISASSFQLQLSEGEDVVSMTPDNVVAIKTMDSYLGIEVVKTDLEAVGKYIDTGGQVLNSGIGANIYAVGVTGGERFNFVGVTGGAGTAVASAWSGGVFVSALLTGQGIENSPHEGYFEVPLNCDTLKISAVSFMLNKLDNDVRSNINKVGTLLTSLNNDAKNGDFSSLDHWNNAAFAQMTADNNVLTVTALPSSPAESLIRTFQQTIERPALGDVIYCAVNVMSENVLPTTCDFFLRGGIDSTDYTANASTRLGEYEFYSKLINVIENPVSDVFCAIRAAYSTRENNLAGVQRFKYATIINLTRLYGAGKEPTKAFVDSIVLSNPNKWIEDAVYVDIRGISAETHANSRDIEDLKDKVTDGTKKIAYQAVAITEIADTRDSYPTLKAVKVTNIVDNEIPYPQAWLYKTNEDIPRFFLSKGVADRPEYLFRWNMALHGSGSNQWVLYMTAKGDIVCIYNIAVNNQDDSFRKNPIIYPAGDYANPIEVQLEIKPTAFLHAGMDYIAKHDILIFAEYTRPQSAECRVWKVQGDLTNPNSWQVVKRFEVSGSQTVGFKHCHVSAYDPFSGIVYIATGDDDSAAAIYYSTDLGSTYTLLDTPLERKYRLTNFLFLEDAVYWASDSGKRGMHFLFRAPRGENGVIAPGTIETLTEIPYTVGNRATYQTCYDAENNRLLMLDRFDLNALEMDIYAWNLNTQKLETVGTAKSVDGTARTFGFRCTAVNWYQGKNEKRFCCGFSNPYPNDIKVLGNVTGGDLDRVCNLLVSLK